MKTMKTTNTSAVLPRNTVTMSFSLDPETKRIIEDLAKSSGKSKSDVVRDNVRYYKWKSEWEKLQSELRSAAIKHSLNTDEDVYNFLNSK